jgi:cytochrome c oxidase subunit 3
MLTLIATEATLFAYLLFSYFYLASHALGTWPPSGAPHLRIAVPGTLILIAGSVVMWWGERGIKRGKPGQLMIGLAAALVLGIAFLAMQGFEWSGEPFKLHTNVYSSLYFTITGFHMLHVIVGLLMLAVLLLWTALRLFHRRSSFRSVDRGDVLALRHHCMAGSFLHFLYHASFGMMPMTRQ